MQRRPLRGSTPVNVLYRVRPADSPAVFAREVIADASATFLTEPTIGNVIEEWALERWRRELYTRKSLLSGARNHDLTHAIDQLVSTIFPTIDKHREHLAERQAQRTDLRASYADIQHLVRDSSWPLIERRRGISNDEQFRYEESVMLFGRTNTRRYWPVLRHLEAGDAAQLLVLRAACDVLKGEVPTSEHFRQTAAILTMLEDPPPDRRSSTARASAAGALHAAMGGLVTNLVNSMRAATRGTNSARTLTLGH